MNTQIIPTKRLTCRKRRDEQGNVLITTLILLVILTLIGIFATQTAQMDLQIAANEIPFRTSFYITEAGLYRQAAELGRGNYPVTNINATDEVLADQDTSDLPAPSPHLAFGQAYDFEVRYAGHYIPPEGYSAIDFSRYDYEVDVEFNNVPVASRLYKVGPKAE